MTPRIDLSEIKVQRTFVKAKALQKEWSDTKALVESRVRWPNFNKFFYVISKGAN